MVTNKPKSKATSPTSTYRVPANQATSSQTKQQKGKYKASVSINPQAVVTGIETTTGGSPQVAVKGGIKENVQYTSQSITGQKTTQSYEEYQKQPAISQIDISKNPEIKQYQESVKQYENQLKKQGIQNAPEYYAAAKGERSPRESSYPETRAYLEKRKKEQEAKKALPIPERYFTAPEIGKREKAVISAAEYLVKKETERAERYAAFEERIKNQPAFFQGAQKLGYAVGVGFGETLTSTALKAFVFTGALTSPSLRPLATTEAKRAGQETLTVLKREYNPTTAKGLFNIGLTSLAIYGLGKYYSVKSRSAFNTQDKNIVSSGRIVATQQQTQYYTKTGQQVTQVKGLEKTYKTGEVLTEKGSITTPKPGKTATVIYPEPTGGKVSIQYAGAGSQGITTTYKKGILYNYERVSYFRTVKQPAISPLGYKYSTPKNELVSRYYRINKLTGKRTEYLKPSVTSNNQAEIKLLEPRPPQTQNYKTGGIAPRVIQKETTITEGLSTKTPGLKLELKTQTITGTQAASVPSAKPGILKTPSQQPSAIIEKTAQGIETTPFKTRIKITKSKATTQQPKQEITLDLERKSITTKTPAIISTETKQATQTSVRLSFNNQNIQPTTTSPGLKNIPVTSQPLIRFKLKPSPPERNLLTVKLQPETATRTVQTPNIQQPQPVTSPNLAIPPDTKAKFVTITAPPSVTKISTPPSPSPELQPSKPVPILKGELTTDNRRTVTTPPGIKSASTPQPKPATINDLGLRNKPINRAITETTPKPKQETTPELILISEPATTARTIPRQIIRIPTLPKPTPTPPSDFIIPPFDLPEPETTNNGIFQTLVRRQGRFKTIGTSPTLEQAQRLGEINVKETAAASFKITKGETTQEINPGFGFTKSKRESGVIIQPREKRISTSGEKSEITFKGIRERKIKKGLKKNFNLFGR